MTATSYQPDRPSSATDTMILAGAGPEPAFDGIMQTFLKESYLDLRSHCRRGGLLDFASLGRTHPWLFRLSFATRGFVCAAKGAVTPTERHVVALRFQADYLRRVDRFAMLRLIEPVCGIFHPNISINNAICIEIYPGESLVEICQSLHDLFRWRLRQYDERDALNPAACVWGRENIEQPIDDRPLFGTPLKLEWQTATKSKGNQL